MHGRQFLRKAVSFYISAFERKNAVCCESDFEEIERDLMIYFEDLIHPFDLADLMLFHQPSRESAQ